MKLELARGMRDISPDDEIIREEIIETFKSIFTSYGFVPLNTPIIERYDVLSAKFAAGEESDAMTETYNLKDNGDRELGLRFDLTVPLSRYIGMNPVMKMPFKRYQIGKVFRDAPIKKGRFREFTQCDVDIIGSKKMIADATCIQIALACYDKLNIDVVIRINNRKFLVAFLENNGLANEYSDSIIMSIDKLDKIGKQGVLKEIDEKGLNSESVAFVLDTLISANNLKSNEEKLSFFEKSLGESEALNELKELFSFFNDNGDVNNNLSLVFDPTLARGLGYYTGTIFEVEASDKSIGSIGGGGRYDKLIGTYIGKNKDFPAVGFSFGLDRIIEVRKKLKLVDNKKSKVQLLIVPMKTESESFLIANKIRSEGINVDIDLMSRNLGKNFSNADDLGIPFVAVIGENELAENKISIKNLSSGEKSLLSVEETISLIKKASDK
ncbi:MAG: histidine--tRNA ligase [Patescibacteria group bacterium]|nr:histidine--tRNA ligase [Patescibacteria group bacterium]